MSITNTNHLRYFEHITKEIGFNPQLDYGLFDPMPDENSRKTIKPLIESDEFGNIVYNIMDIFGNIRTHDVSEAKSKVSIKPIQLIRKADPGDGPRYLPGKTGQGVWPWISREIVEAFKKKTKVKRLILTEGYKKAFVACKHDVFCIGLPGITVWKSKESKDVFHDIKLFVEACSVEDILWLTDSDTLHVQWEPNKDLYKRPHAFFTSVTLFKSLCRDWNINLFYAHIHEESKDKGIDDLFISNSKDSKKISKELLSTAGQTFYFRRYNVTTMPFYKIQEIFGIDKDAHVFYDKYAAFIGLEEFIYRNGVYSYDIDKNELIYRKSGEAAQYVRIMKDYYMLASVPTASAFCKNTRINTDESSIKAKYKDRSKKEVERILYDIEFFDGAFNEPDHLNYKSTIYSISDEEFVTKWYNKYMKITHKPLSRKIEESEIPLSLKFVKHIFGTAPIMYKGKKIYEYDLGLDYMQLLYLKPKQILPIVSLVSAEQQTGKTLFWQWCVAIFQQNAKIIPPDMLTGNFTEYFMNCLLVIIDEALFNKRETIERVKSMTTNSETMVNGKHAKEVETQTYLKVGLSSNNINDFAILTKKDERFWVRDIPSIPEEDFITDFYTKICDEIPFFLTYLKDREMATDNDDRMYFAPWLRNTKALERVMNKSRSGDEILIEESIKDYMTAAGKPCVELSLSDIRELTGERNTLSLSKIRWVVEDRWSKSKHGYSRKYKFYEITADYVLNSELSVSEKIKSTNPYVFNAYDFFTVEEIFKFFKIEDIIEAEDSINFDLKSRVSVEEFIIIRYPDTAELPCDHDNFVRIYNSSKTFKKFYTDIDLFLFELSALNKKVTNKM